MTTQPSLPDSTAGLYNTLCSGLKLDNQQFQMIQGVLPVQSNASGLYNFFDGIPPKSVATLYTSNPINGLNGNMQIVISDAKPSFLTTLAMNNYQNPKYWVDGNVAVDPIYTPTFADLYAQVAAGSQATVNFDSATASSDLSSSWAQNDGSAGVGFWGTSSSSVSQTLNTKAASSRITVNIYLDKFAYFPIRAGGWFTQGFFADQYRNPQKWTGGQSAWDAVFGSTGSCQYLANQVMMVNGYTIVTTSHAQYSQSDYSLIKSSSDTNVWPFYTSSSSSQATQSFNYNSDQSITTTITCKPGSLQIFGMGVILTSTAMGGSSAKLQLNSRLI
ncbi:MAG: hypothetical protein WA821_08095 [Anaerolineales bacterium]